MKLEGHGFVVRDLEPRDAVSLAQFADNRNIWLNLRDRFPHPYSLADAEAWIEHCLSKTGPDRSYAIEKNGEAIGNVGCTMYQAERRHVADVGYWIGEPFWGQGIATQAFGMYSDYLFSHSEVIRQEAAVYAWNPRSCRVVEKNGFVREGCMKSAVIKDGQITNVYLYAKVKS